MPQGKLEIIEVIDVAIVGAGFAGTCAAHALASSGARVKLIDRLRAFPDLFRAEKIEPDQAQIMRKLNLLHLREPEAAPIGIIMTFDGNEAKPIDTGEQYGIAYAPTVNKLRANLPPGVEVINEPVSRIVQRRPHPRIEFRDGTCCDAKLIVLATGGNNSIIESIGLERTRDSSLMSLTFGFDVTLTEQKFQFNGFNYYIPTNPARIDYLTIFRIGERMRVNLFTQLRPKDEAVARIKGDPVAALHTFFPRLMEHLGPFELNSAVQVVPTAYQRLRNPARAGIVAIGEEFQTVSPATGTGLSRVLTDVDVLCTRYVPQWLQSERIRANQVRDFYSDQDKIQSDRRALGTWMHYSNEGIEGGPSLSQRVRQQMKLMGWTG